MVSLQKVATAFFQLFCQQGFFFKQFFRLNLMSTLLLVQ